MVTQNKYIYIRFNSNKEQTLKLNINKLTPNQVIFKFNEHDTINIYHDSDYKIELEASSYYQQKLVHTKDNLFELKKNIDYLISCKDKEDLYYLPSEYYLYIYINDNRLSFKFLVTTNNNTNLIGLEKMRILIESFEQGLSYDYYNKDKIIRNSHRNANELPYILEYVRLNNHKILGILNSYNSNSFNTIKSCYIKEPYLNKQNAKTIRKNLTIPNNGLYLNKIKVINNNSLENQAIKYIFKTIINKLDSINKEFNNIYNNHKTQFNLKSSLTNTILDNETNANSKRLRTMAEKNHLSQRLSKFDLWNNNLSKINNLIKQIYNSRYFCSVSNLDTLPLLSTLSFNELEYGIYKIYKDICSKNKTAIFPYKRSYLLFEIYAFVLLHTVLLDLGYEISKNKEPFKQNSEYLYTKRNYSVRIIYDRFISYYANSNLDSVVNVNSSHTSPDFQIIFYKNKIATDITIFEIKYRSLYKLFKNNEINPEIMKISDDYSQLKYIDNNGNIKLNLLNKVIFLYPNIEEEIIDFGIFSKLLGIDVNKDLVDTKAYKVIYDLITENEESMK